MQSGEAPGPAGSQSRGSSQLPGHGWSRGKAWAALQRPAATASAPCSTIQTPRSESCRRDCGLLSSDVAVYHLLHLGHHHAVNQQTSLFTRRKGVGAHGRDYATTGLGLRSPLLSLGVARARSRQVPDHGFGVHLGVPLILWIPPRLGSEDREGCGLATPTVWIPSIQGDPRTKACGETGGQRGQGRFYHQPPHLQVKSRSHREGRFRGTQV